MDFFNRLGQGVLEWQTTHDILERGPRIQGIFALLRNRIEGFENKFQAHGFQLVHRFGNKQRARMRKNGFERNRALGNKPYRRNPVVFQGRIHCNGKR